MPANVKGTEMPSTINQAAAIRRAFDFLAGRTDPTGTPVTHEDASSGLALLAWHAYQALSRSTTPEQAAALLGERVLSPQARIYSGYDDDERWFPFFTSPQEAQKFAEDSYRCSDPETGEHEFTWHELKERTSATGYPDAWDLRVDGEWSGYRVCGVQLFTDAATAIVAEELEQDANQRELAALRTGENEQAPADPVDECRPVTLPSGEIIRVHGGAPMSQTGAAALGELVELTRKHMAADNGGRDEIGPEARAFLTGYRDGLAEDGAR